MGRESSQARTFLRVERGGFATMKRELSMRMFLVLFCAALAVPSASALDPERRISQYAHTAWRVRDGIFAGAPIAITQTTDGYIWIGTHSGLLRFDGVRFVPFTPPAGKRLPNPAVHSLVSARDGSLWIGTASGLAQWKNGELINFPETTGRVDSIYEDRDGTIWMGRTRRTDLGGICKVAASIVTCYGAKDRAPSSAHLLIADNLGYLWIGYTTGLLRWKPGSSTLYELPGLKSSIGLHGVGGIALARDGSVWAGVSQPGHGLGLEELVNGSWKTLITPAFDSSTLDVNGLLLDRHDALWIATEGAGIYRVHDGKVDHFRGVDGLSSDSASSFFEDREGNLWVATPDGIDCFRDIPVVDFSVREGLNADKVNSILAAHDGTVWIGNRGALDYVRGGVVGSIRRKEGLVGQDVTSLFEDHTGLLWVGIDNGLFRYERGRFTPVQRAEGGLIGIVVAMAEDENNQIWAAAIRNPHGPPAKLGRIRDDMFVEEVLDKTHSVFAMTGDPQGGLWLGFSRGGLGRYRNGQLQIFPLGENVGIDQVLGSADGSVLASTNEGLFEWRGENRYTLNEQSGLPCKRVYAMVRDKYSNLWLYAQCGLIEIKDEELQRWRQHPEAKVKCDLFDAYDGAQPYLPAFRPVATRSSDGRLWFANESVVQMVDPNRLGGNSLPPPVHIEGVIADRKEYSPGDNLRLPALTRDLEIDYTALSFVVPQKVRFRYKLEGYDRDWQDPKTRRQAFYSNLRPKSYRFRVMAANNAGVWNEHGATLEFAIMPAFYQTGWFIALCAVSTLLLVYLLYRLRVRQLAMQFAIGLEERVSERTRIARELHDTLLQNFQGLLPRLQAVLYMLPERPTEARKTLEAAVDKASEAVTEGRDAVKGLRLSTVEKNDLGVVVRTLGEELAAATVGQPSPTFEVAVEGTPRNLHPILRDEVYRLAAEALQNAFRHAQARKIEVEIRYGEKEFRLQVRDDGRGIDPSVLSGNGREGHYGLHGMHERAKIVGGKLKVWSELQSGTEVELSIPASRAYTQPPRRLRLLQKLSGKDKHRQDKVEL